MNSSDSQIEQTPYNRRACWWICFSAALYVGGMGGFMLAEIVFESKAFGNVFHGLAMIGNGIMITISCSGLVHPDGKLEGEQ